MLTKAATSFAALNGKDGHLFALPVLTTFSKAQSRAKQWSFHTPRRTWGKAWFVPFIGVQDGSLTEV